MKKSLIRIISFLILLACVLAGINHVLKFKYNDGVDFATIFYEQEKESIDVLILGSSHAFCSFNTGVLWDEYGMASFIWGGPSQPMWNSYYNLQEALKTQKPELIVLEGYGLKWGEGEQDRFNIIANTFGMQWSVDKMEAIKAGTPQEQWGDYLAEYVQYHMRYKELSSEDFLKNKREPIYENWKGSQDLMSTECLDNPDVLKRWAGGGVNEKIYEKTEKYYRMIIELAQENGIPIVVVVSPYEGIYAQDLA